jgi:hypothetical protein
MVTGLYLVGRYPYRGLDGEGAVSTWLPSGARVATEG